MASAGPSFCYNTHRLLFVLSVFSRTVFRGGICMVTTLLVALLTALASLVHIPVGDSELNKSIYKIPLVFSLVICDFGGNALEYILRFLYAAEVWKDTSLLTILIAAFVRSITIVLCVFLYRRFIEPHLSLKKEESP